MLQTLPDAAPAGSASFDLRAELLAAARPGIEAVRRFWRPFLLIQICSALLVWGYFSWPPLADFCVHLMSLKQAGGIFFAAIVGGFAGGILPEIAKTFSGVGRRFTRARLDDAAFATAWFAVSAVIVDLFYRGQGLLFGDDGALLTTIKKVAFDQFLFTPLLMLPAGALLYLWRQKRYRLRPTAAELGPRFCIDRVVTLLIPAWAYWIPMTMLIYSLPGPLQFSLFALALAAWSLVFTLVAARHTPQCRT